MSAVPDLVKIGSIKTATDMTVNTTILEPVVNSKSFTRFLLDKTGILHSHSKIAFGIQNDGSSGNAAGQERYVTFPLYTGSYSLINRCVLKAGSKVITSTDDFSHLMAYRSRFVDNVNNVSREQMLTARTGAYTVVPNPPANLVGATADSEMGVSMDTGENHHMYTDGANIDVDGTGFRTVNTPLPKYMRTYGTNRIPPAGQADQTVKIQVNPTFQVSLSDMFPVLRSRQLPLFLMQEQVSIEIYWEDPNKVMVQNIVDGITHAAVVPLAEADQHCSISLPDTRLVADYIYFPDDIMAAYRAKIATEGLTIQFAEHQLVKTTFAGAYTGGDHDPTAVAPTSLTRNLGGASKLVSDIVIAHQRNDPPLNLVFNSCDQHDCTYQLKYNDRLLFPQSVGSQTVLRHNVHNVSKIPMHITQLEYSGQGANQLAFSPTSTVDGFPINSLKGQQHYVAFDLNRGERVNSRGLQLDMRGTFVPLNSPYPEELRITQRVWLSIQKVMTLKAGLIDCYYA